MIYFFRIENSLRLGEKSTDLLSADRGLRGKSERNILESQDWESILASGMSSPRQPSRHVRMFDDSSYFTN